MDAAYVFRVRFRLEPADVRLDPQEFETVLSNPAPPPGEEGWLFFRNNLWRGDVNDEAHMRDVFTDELDARVVSVTFSELQTDEEYFEALKAEIADNLDAFNASNVSEVINKYLGSSVRVG